MRCLLRLGLEPPLPRAFGKYELRRQIGRGGMGVVFEAREFNPDRLVALKMIRTGELASAEERELFRREAQEASLLEHRNIVTIFHVGDAEEPAYYTMRLMTGGTLAEHGERLRRDPRQVAQLVATVARAVHHGHARGVLHRDLKPANILLDGEGQPHVADFGIARRIDDEDDPLTASPLGTPHYMSPEQAGPGPCQLTTKSDVYSLGTILFELLTGRPPFDGETVEAVLQQQRTAVPPRPRSLGPQIHPDLEAICLNCLEKAPERRFNADQLADDLEGFLRGDPVAARPLRASERASRWLRRHPAAASSVATATLFVAIALGAAFAIAREQAIERREDVLKANAFAARSIAGLALFELAKTREEVEGLAADPRIIARLGGAPCGRFDFDLQGLVRPGTFVTIGGVDAQGRSMARWPERAQPAAYCARTYAWCDHFKGAARHAATGRHLGYLARPSRSEETGEYKFTVSAPVFAVDGRWLGVVYGSVGTDAMLGPHRLNPDDDPRRTAALIARPDNPREAQDAALPRGYVVLVHERLEPGQAYPVSSEVLDGMAPSNPDGGQFEVPVAGAPLTDGNYRDPVPGFEGRWLAGIAPVGNTDYAIVVQTRYAAVFAPDEKLAGRLGWWVGLPFALGALAINLLLLWARRRGR